LPAGKKTRKSARSKSKVPVALLFWLGFFIVMGFLFLINLQKIRETWANVFGEDAESGQEADDKAGVYGGGKAAGTSGGPDEAGKSGRTGGVITGQDTAGADETWETGAAGKTDKSDNDEKNKTGSGTETRTGEYSQTEDEKRLLELAIRESDKDGPGGADGSDAEEGQKPDGETAPGQGTDNSKTAERKLYFVRVDDGGIVFLSDVKRSMPVSRTPLAELLQALLRGPAPAEQAAGIRSLIPEGTEVTGARVSDGTAYINFNENFLFNNFGADGYIAQLREIVWTVTGLPGINHVQILIEGRKVDFLGETIRIDKPLSRASF